MLVLSRRIGEQVIIAGKVSVTIVEIKGGQVRLGVTAPKSIQVDRQEVHLRRCREDVSIRTGASRQVHPVP